MRLPLTALAMLTAFACYAQTTKQATDVKSSDDVMFQRADRNQDGFIEANEAPPRARAMISDLDSDDDGKISLAEFLARRVNAVDEKRRLKTGGRQGEVVAPAAKEERYPEALKTGDVAAEFNLPRVDGKATVSLSELRHDKPVVLVFGSISCSPFRREVQAVEKLYQQYRDQVNFAMIYIREAHPDSELFVEDEQGEKLLKKFVQTDDLKLRKSHAQYCERTLNLSFPMLLDSVDNQTNKAYSAWPIRLVIVGTDGKVISPGAKGPQGFSPETVATWASQLTIDSNEKK